MPVEVRYEDGGAGVRLFGTGLVAGDELYAANEEIYIPDYLRSQRYQLVDFTGAESFELSKEDVRRLAEQDRRAAEMKPNLATAIAGDQDLIFGLSPM